MSDLIDRQETINYFFRPYSNEETYSNTDIERILKSMPAVKSDKKYGVWHTIHGHTSKNVDRRIVRCSECYSDLSMRGVNAGRSNANFCPYCGADMRGGFTVTKGES